MAGDEDHRDSPAADIELLLQLEPGHLGHSDIAQQAATAPRIVVLEKRARRRKAFHRIPGARSMNLRPCLDLTAASSSTANTLLSGISARFRLGCRQIEEKGRAGANPMGHSNTAAVRLHYRAADRKPHAHAERFGRYERLEGRIQSSCAASRLELCLCSSK